MKDAMTLQSIRRLRWLAIPSSIFLLLAILWSEYLQANLMRLAYWLNYSPITSLVVRIVDPRYTDNIEYLSLKAKALKSDPALAKSNSMVKTLEKLSRISPPAQAPALLQEAITIIECNAEQPSVAFNDRVELTVLFLNRNQPEAALEVIRDTVRITEKRYGANSAELADILLRLASLYPKLSPHKPQLEEFYKRSVDISVLLYGENSPKVEGALSDLGAFYTFHKQYQNAESIYRRRLKIAEHEGSIWLRHALLDLASILPKVGKSMEAEKLAERAESLPVSIGGCGTQ